MANLTELSQWESGIYQLETTDSVEAGAGGISNEQARLLGNRTRWLKDQIFPGELKWLNVDASFVSTNFPSGLGIGIYTGWKVSSDMDGRIAVAYGGFFSTIGATGGSKDAVLLAHSHYNGVANGQQSLNVYGSTTAGMPGFATAGIDEFGEPRTYQGITSTVGESGISKNMPPFKVVLCIEKI